MTECMEAATNEIARVAAWSLRALNMKFAVAERGAPIVAWAEAVEGGALETLRTRTSHLSQSRDNWRQQISPCYWKFDATGRSLLEIGPVAIDLLTLAARNGDVGRVDIVNAVDPVFLSGIVRIGSKRKIGVVALSSIGDLTLCGRPVESIHAYSAADRLVFDENNLPQDEAIKDAVAEWRRQKPLAGDTSTISLFSYLPRDGSTSKSFSSPQNDAEAKFKSAVAHGVQVKKSELDNLYQLEVITWAPTSERSRGQALFQADAVR
jgi:hypothetical protein